MSELVPSLPREPGDAPTVAPEDAIDRDTAPRIAEHRHAAAAGAPSLVSAEDAARLERELDKTAAALAVAQRRLDFIYRSTSWRITLPLRVADRPIRRFKRFLARLRNGPPPEPPPPPSAAAHLADTLAGCTVLFAIGTFEGESRRYRVHNVAELLRQRGHDVGELATRDVGVIVDFALRPDVIVVFRSEWDQSIKRLFDYTRPRGIRVLYDIDDLLIDPAALPLIRYYQGLDKKDQRDYRGRVDLHRAVLLACDGATVSTETLARAVRKYGKPAAVIRNSINAIQIEMAEHLLARPARTGTAVVIGYFSGTATHDHDFRVAEPALLRIMDAAPNVRLRIVGPLVLGEAWRGRESRIERVPFQPYQKMLEVLHECDIAIAPLELNNAFNDAKSELKWFEAALVSVPVVVSATESFRAAVAHGETGYLASDDAGWYDALHALVRDPALRRRIGQAAREAALRTFGPEAVAREVEAALGLPVSTAPVPARARDRGLRIDWILPGLFIGGEAHRDVLALARQLTALGHRVGLHVTATRATATELRALIHRHHGPLDADIKPYDAIMPYTDVVVATHWSTVEPALACARYGRDLIYFVQDFDALAAPMSSEHILAESTYRMGLACVAASPWCAWFLKNQFGCTADTLEIAIDRTGDTLRPRRPRKPHLVFYANPEVPGRCYDLGILMLRRLHDLMKELDITLYGSREVNRDTVGFKVAIVPPAPTAADAAKLYASADLGVVLSTTTANRVAYEMMACGTPVVDLARPGNEINYGGRTDIALLADPQPEKMAKQIHALLLDAPQRAARSAAGIEFVSRLPTGEEVARRFERLLLGRLAANGYPR